MNDFTITHEIAHAYIHELQVYPADLDLEAEADRLAMGWGFTKTPNKKRKKLNG